MLIDRIDIESCGALEHLQLGPFSPRLNAVYGACGADSTATIAFIRSVMLGSDREWHRGSAGTVVWADSTPDLPRRTIEGLVVATRQTSLDTILAACHDAGLDAPGADRDEAAIIRLRVAIADLDRRLAAYPVVASTLADLDLSRRRLLDELDAMDRAELTTSDDDTRREQIRLRLSETRDEVARLGQQEIELRHLISEIERDLVRSADLPQAGNSHWRIAAAHRRQLEELDNELMHWRRTLREISALRGSLEHVGSDLYADALPLGAEPPHSAAIGRRIPLRSAESRLTSAYRQISRLSQRYDRSKWGAAASGEELHGDAAVPSHLSSADVEVLADALRLTHHELQQVEGQLSGARLDMNGAAMRELQGSDQEVTGRHHVVWHEGSGPHLRRCAEVLVRAIDRLIGSRNALLRQIAAEYDLPLGQLNEAFGDWRQCHDHPHLYQWLLSDRCPPRVDDIVVHASRSARLERERARLLDDLSRTVNRLDSQSNEVHLLELRLRRLPVAPAVDASKHRREACRAELARLDEQLRWLSDRQPLDEERQRLERRLQSLWGDSPTSWPLLTRASQWLTRLSSGCSTRLELLADGSLRIDGGALGRLGEVERQTLALALRMAAVEELGRRGCELPLLVDEPPSGLRVGDTPWRVATALARFVDAGRQVIVFTESRPLANAIRNVGGRLQSLSTPQYIQMRYRDGRSETKPDDPLRRADALQNVNRDLDMAWREANGLYDDPHWYRSAEWRHGEDTVPRGLDRSGARGRPEAHQTPRSETSPFFLSEASPVDQAPSIDPLIATRLGTIGITRVGHLLVSDPHYIARCLHLNGVTSQVVQRWQNEARLVCRVPQLRNFDARVLVGCGFTGPKQLAQMHAGDLLEKVEAFLATERGREILRSGTSYELSRITSWIAAANRSVARGTRHGERSSAPTRIRYESGDRNASTESASREASAAGYVGDGSKRPGRRRRSSREGSERAGGRRRDRRQTEPDRAAAPHGVVSMHASNSAQHSETRDAGRFHLDRRSPIINAPAIGPKTAARLEDLAIRTVGDLLNADPAEVAAELGSPKIDEQRVRRWQQQASLVCRVPSLCGDDAELLVAVGIIDPERLAQCEPSWLLSRITPVAHSARGKRILGGAAVPDLAEVSDWIEWAKERRSLRAA